VGFLQPPPESAVGYYADRKEVEVAYSPEGQGVRVTRRKYKGRRTI
jgi:hypothetical protein